MYRIAIGDDDPIFLKEIESLVSGYLETEGLKRSTDFSITCFSSASSLLAALEKEQHCCQLLLLDVEFGRDNGLTVASSLRRMQAEFSLIYISSHREYVFDSFDTRPLHYLLKPVDGEKLTVLIREDWHHTCFDAHIILKIGGRHISLAYRDLYAVESAQHRVFLHLKDRTEEWTGSLRTLAPELPGWCFCRCHNSYFVNLTHVTELVRYEARLDNAQVIPVSKRFYKSAIEQYIAFLKINTTPEGRGMNDKP